MKMVAQLMQIEKSYKFDRGRSVVAGKTDFLDGDTEICERNNKEKCLRRGLVPIDILELKKFQRVARVFFNWKKFLKHSQKLN